MNLRSVNGLVVTESVSILRSGHHWLWYVLGDYFGPRLSHCDADNPLYSGKRIVECPATNFERNLHDRELSHPILGDRQHLIQIRDPVEALASRWALEKESFGQTEEAWRGKMAEWLDYCHRFLLKWVYAPIPNRLIVRYADLVAAPVDRVAEVVQFLEADRICDMDRLVASLGKWPFQRQVYKVFPY